MTLNKSPELEAAQYAHSLYVQRRIDIADEYTRQCSENKDRLVRDLAEIAREHGVAPTRVVRMAFGADRTDFVGPVRRVLSTLKAGDK